MKLTKVLLNVLSVVCFIFGALYIFSLVFIPIGVYCFLAGKRFSYKAEHIYDIYTVSNQILKNYTIFVCIACFPLGLLSIIAYKLVASNNVKVEALKIREIEQNVEPQEPAETENNVSGETVEPVVEETEDEKQEKFKKLQNFKDKGIISEEELEMAREQLFGKKDEEKK